MTATIHTLKSLRRNAPQQDLHTEALRLPVAPPYKFQTPYNPAAYPSDALTALRVQAGSLADAAVEEAKWSAIGLWLSCIPAPSQLTNPLEVAQATYRFCREARRMAANWPSLSGRPYSSLLHGYSAATVEAAWDVCAETLKDWERSRSPRFAGAIRRVSNYLRSVFPTKSVLAAVRV
ncbi:hypothetical protein D3Y57_16795 [Sphingomonas paeninsulae]|uniref:Uncharacterized protein n=1 Tax=Sphingomonas paeninsulae TaxID=2319844 RepID=A0A494TCS0_SPHPE|nr:hypothetical protein D3Y57_16795 [Sphingomonas paeninsulae]